MKMKQYDPDYGLNFNSNHTVKIRFLYGETEAEIVTTLGGNVSGVEVITSVLGSFESYLSVPSDIECNQLHCLFCDDEENEGKRYRDVDCIVFRNKEGATLLVDVEQAGNYVVSAEIIEYQENSDDEEDE